MYSKFFTAVLKCHSVNEKYLFPDTMGIDMSGYDFSTIVNILKKFLLELPDSVIPVQWYDRLLELGGK